MLKRTLAIACAGLMLASQAAWAQNVGEGLVPTPDQSTTRVGTRGANFLELAVGARAQGLGNSGMALVDGAEALYWNVASIAETEAFSVAWTYSLLYDDADVTHQFGGVVFPLNDVSAIGVSFIALNSGDILRTSESFPDGGDPQFGETFDYSAFAGQLAYARSITDRLSVGGGLKFISEGITSAKANWVGVDVGAKFRTGLIGATIGGAITNLGGDARMEGSGIESTIQDTDDAFPTGENVSVNYNTTALQLPTAFRFSVLFDVTGTPEAWFPAAGPNFHLRWLVDFYDSIDTPLMPSTGFEFAYKEYFFVRLGKQWANENNAGEFKDFWGGTGFGGGLKIPLSDRYSLGFDYAYANKDALENIQTFSFNFGSF